MAAIRIWEVPGGRTLRTLTGHTAARALSFLAGGRRLATAGIDPALCVWNLDVDRDDWTLNTPGSNSIVRLGIGPDGRRLAGVDGAEFVLAWADGPRGSPHAFPGACFVLPAAAETIAISGADGHIRVLNVASGAVLRDLPGRVHPWGPLEFVDGGRKIVTSSMGATRAVKDMTIELRDAEDGRRLGAWPAGPEPVAIRPDGLEMAMVRPDDRIACINLSNGQERLTFAVPARPNHVLYSPDGHRIVTHHPAEWKWSPTGNQEAGRCRVWDARDGRPLGDLVGNPLRFDPDGSGLFTSTPDGRVRWFDAGMSEVRTFAGHEGEITRALVTPDRKRLITASRDATIRIWDLATGQQVLVLRGHHAAVNDLALAPDGAYLASASLDSTLRVWPSASQAGRVPSEPSRPATRERPSGVR